jgi:hypothetical protein
MEQNSKFFFQNAAKSFYQIFIRRVKKKIKEKITTFTTLATYLPSWPDRPKKKKHPYCRESENKKYHLRKTKGRERKTKPLEQPSLVCLHICSLCLLELINFFFA